ncbi:hypothetical protein KDH_66890 [Dictyobacter sp. S3.2.2.5]|uniref:Uncharacterized protein n=1 Tax=Dictyobacter halimunensis TaxID=3026934 RepID=A0ABQ6G2Z2_9CHLR|nr:hypothetical protein KDH_66890 [Dictyobacter sp. S3.2.2.5]
MNKAGQKDIFNIFHDGSFQNFCPVGNDRKFDVDIEYLVQVVNPHYTFSKE